MSAGLVELEVVVRRQTDDAYGLEDPDTPGGLIWLPKSQCTEVEINYPSKAGTLKCPEWLAIKKGLV